MAGLRAAGARLSTRTRGSVSSSQRPHRVGSTAFLLQTPAHKNKCLWARPERSQRKELAAECRSVCTRKGSFEEPPLPEKDP